MTLYRTEGIIIHALDFRDHDKILTVFSPDHGLIKLFLKGILIRRHSRPVTAPLTRSEFVCKKRTGDLLLCREMSTLDQQLILRRDLKTLEAACELLQLVKRTQFPDKPAPDLYRLMIQYLRFIPSLSIPDVLTTSFRLKLLRHEGLFGISTTCHHCGTALADFLVARGESFCRQHAPSQALLFSKKEGELLHHLAFCRNLTALPSPGFTINFKEKVAQFFEDVISLV